MSGHNSSIHIEGMGLTGAMLATLLNNYGVGFTWNDTYEKKTAWKASTGCIYPGGSVKFGPDEPCRKIWAYWYALDHLFGRDLERCNFVFNHKTSPPHKGKYNVIRTSEDLKIAVPNSFHLNAQLFVPRVRKMFERFRVDHPPNPKKVDFYIRAHGFGPRMSHVYWGWARLVQLRYGREYSRDNLRPCFYFRDGRFIMTYVYPVPNTEFWYAGSHIIKQKVMKSLDVNGKYKTWKKHFLRLSHGAVEIIQEHYFMEGWRPAAGDDDWITFEDGILSVRPLWNSGIRHFPKQWVELADILGLRIEESLDDY